MSPHDAIDFGTLRAPASGVGAMLRERRVELGLSQNDVANYVKLPARRIEAMENERWDELPDGPFLRGFLKNVARALDLDANTLMARVDESLIQSRNPESILVPPGSARGTLPRRSGPAAEHRAGRPLVIGACLFALAAALIAWSGTESFDRVVSGGRRLVAPSNAPTVPAAAPVAREREPEPAPAPLLTTAPAPAPLVAAADVPGAADGAKALTFHFNEESWVEVRSADGKLLLQRLNAPGTDQTIEGEAPFTLVVGNAKGVALQYRGHPVDLGPHTRDQVARLTLS